MYTELHIGFEVIKELRRQKRSVSWLAEEIGCDNSNLGKQLNKQHLSSELMFRISSALGKDFFKLFSETLSDPNRNA